MTQAFLDIAVTPSVRAVQQSMGTENLWRDRGTGDAHERLRERETAFIAARDSFFMATVSESGWPYVQHRGGPPGFLKILDDRTLAFADFRGNRQYISTGNLAVDDRACLFLIDYARRARLKIFADVEVVSLETDPALTELVIDPAYRAKVERILKLRIAAFDWNCPQHITQRFTEAEVDETFCPLRERLAGLEAENALLRERVAKTTRRSGADET